MKLSELYLSDYSVTYLNCLRQSWTEDKVFSCIGNPKERDLLFMPEGCDLLYTLPNGEKLRAKDGDTVLLPRGSEYTLTFENFTAPIATSVAVNFHLKCNPEYRTENITIVTSPNARSLFLEAERLTRSARACPARFNSVILEIITAIGESSLENQKHTSAIVNAALEYMHANISESIDVAFLAQMSGVSEVYFRRLFKQAMGMTAVRYRLLLRLRRAADYLRYTDLSVGAIADSLGFSDSPHLVRAFRAEFGVTPYEYKRRF